MDGWIKLHRKTLENAVVMHSIEYLGMWTYLLLNATHKEINMWFGGKSIILKPGQLITGRKSLARELLLNEHKVDRILKTLESEQQIEQQTTNQNRLITVLNWNKYQNSEQQIEQQVSNDRATGEQQVSTNKNVRSKECKNEKNTNEVGKRFLNAWNATFETNFTSTTAIDNNLAYWLTQYSEDDIYKAMSKIKDHDFWSKEQMSPSTFVRRRNPRGDEVDYIGEMLNLKTKEVFYA